MVENKKDIKDITQMIEDKFNTIVTILKPDNQELKRTISDEVEKEQKPSNL